MSLFLVLKYWIWVGILDPETRKLEFSRQQRCLFPPRLLSEMQGGPRMFAAIVVPLVENVLRAFGDNWIPWSWLTFGTHWVKPMGHTLVTSELRCTLFFHLGEMVLPFLPLGRCGEMSGGQTELGVTGNSAVCSLLHPCFPWVCLSVPSTLRVYLMSCAS